MRRTASNYICPASGSTVLWFGPFFKGDFLEELDLQILYYSMAVQGSKITIAMVASPDELPEQSDEKLSREPLSYIPTSSNTQIVYRYPLNEFVQPDKRYLSVRLLDGTGAQQEGVVLVKYTPGRIGRRA